MELKLISLYAMAALYCFAGIMHFVKTDFFMKIMPPYIPFHKAAVYLSGIAEILLGVALCIPLLSSWAAWGVIALLIAVFPANIYMLQNKRAGQGTPKWMLVLRLPIQFLLMAWAWWHTF